MSTKKNASMAVAPKNPLLSFWAAARFGALLLVFAGLQSAVAQVQRLTDEEREDIDYVRKTLGDRGMVTLDLSDPREERFMVKQLEMAGITPRSNPELFHAVAEARHTKLASAPPPSGPQPLALITDVSTNDQKSFVADALATVNGGAFVSIVTLGLYDKNDQLLGPVSKTEDYTGGQRVIVRNEAQFPNPPGPNGQEIHAMGSWFYQDNKGGQHFAEISLQSQMYPVSITAQAPNTVYDPNLIHVCVNRTGSIGGCDYDCNKGLNCNQTPQTTPATIMFPVQGSIVYPGSIDPIQFGGDGKPTNAYSLITTTLDAVGGACTQTAAVNFFKDPNTKITGPNNNTLVWNLNPAIFGTACYQANVNANYAFAVYVTVNGQIVYSFINNTGVQSKNTVVIKPMAVFFGCVAEGTKVELEDGMQVPVEGIHVNQQIAGDRALSVTNVISGTEDDPIIHIQTSHGDSLLLSRSHPVVTPRGVVVAYRLHVGDEVITAHGPDKLVSVVSEKYAGKVWNLDLGQTSDNSLTHLNTTFFANGILVGDSKMQGYWENEDRRDKRTVLERLPQRWHQDYLNWLAEQKNDLK